MKYRCGIVTNKGRIESHDYMTRDEVDDYILSFDKEEVVTKFRIIDLEINEVIETELGKR